MLSTRSISVAAATLVSSMILAVTAFAKDGREFAGFYCVTSVTEQDSQVQVNLNLQLFNYTGTDLKNVTISVREAPGTATYGSFAPVTLWRDGHDIILSRQFNIPRQEFERWSASRQPHVYVEFKDSADQEWSYTAQLNHVNQVPF